VINQLGSGFWIGVLKASKDGVDFLFVHEVIIIFYCYGKILIPDPFPADGRRG
jgi:hypothetical protein